MIITYFAKLPPEIMILCIYYTVKQSGVNQLKVQVDSLYKAIDYGFIWGRTKEGHNYWENIYVNFLKKKI